MKLSAFKAELSKALVAREAEVEAFALALIAKEHIFFFGPPGVAKSFLCSSVAEIIGASYYEVLMTKFSEPDDVFGPVAISGLKQDRYFRNIQGRLPTVQLGFVDEIFKANAGIINALLTIMQERKFDNDGQRVDCPLHTLAAASNEWPEPGELDALFDRFLIRKMVKPVPTKDRQRLVFGDIGKPDPIATMDEINAAHEAAMKLEFTKDAQDCYFEIAATLEQNDIRPGDRRLRKCANLCKAKAKLDDNMAVHPRHLAVLGDSMWTRHEQAEQATEIVQRIAFPELQKLNDIALSLADIADHMPNTTEGYTTALGKLDELLKDSKQVEGLPQGQDLISEINKQKIIVGAKMFGVSEEAAQKLVAAT